MVSYAVSEVEEWDAMKKIKVFKVGHLRKFEQQVHRGEISYTKMIEILNDMAYEAYSNR